MTRPSDLEITDYEWSLRKLERMVSTANATGMRYRTARGWKWHVLPVEYLLLVNRLMSGPDDVRAAAQEVCA